jgi:phosphatidylserine decarboxylase
MYLGILVVLLMLTFVVVNLHSVTHSKMLATPLILLYRIVYNVDLSDAQTRNFRTFNDFFTRKVVRKIEDEIVSPVDGLILTYGRIKNKTLLQIKGKRYRVDELLQGELPAVNYNYVTFYLHPREYHRVHLPCDANLISYKDIIGRSLPVNILALTYVDGLYTENTRSVLVFEVNGRLLILVLVGALFVDSVDHIKKLGHYKKADEVGKFNAGSTVVMIYDASLLTLDNPIKEKQKFGQRIGKLT